MTEEIKQSSPMVILISVLGVLTIALLAGLLLMRMKRGEDSSFDPSLVFRQNPQTTDYFDPISWAREDAAYPPLQEAEDVSELDTDYNDDGALPEVKSDESPEVPTQNPVVQSVPSQVQSSNQQTVVPLHTQISAEQVVQSLTQFHGQKNLTVLVQAEQYREVTEKAYWVQIFSSTDQSRAEDIQTKLAKQGMPAVIQVKRIDGTLRYRVRLGAFSLRSEAEHYAAIIREIDGFRTSYVVIAPVTRQMPRDS